MTARLLLVVSILSTLNFNRDCSCGAVRSIPKANILGAPETPSKQLLELQMSQIKRLNETLASQVEIQRQLKAAIAAQKYSMNGLHASNRKAFFDMQDAATPNNDTQLTDDQISQQALNNIMVVANEVGRLVQWKSVTLDTFINNNFPDLTGHLKMMITTAYANAHILQNTKTSAEIKQLVSKLVSALEALTKLLMVSVTTINTEAERVVQLYNTVSGQAAQQMQREADMLKRALDLKAAEKHVFDRAQMLIQNMACHNATADQLGVTSTPGPVVTTKHPVGLELPSAGPTVDFNLMSKIVTNIHSAPAKPAETNNAKKDAEIEAEEEEDM